MRRIAMTVAGVVVALTLAACGSSSTSSTTGAGTSGSSAASSASAGEHNAADVMFAHGMIPHHEQAIEMGKLAPSRAASAEVKTLATQIQGAQDPEINQMTGWLSTWGESTTMSGGMGHTDHMSGMMSSDDMTKLEGLSGKAFDREFLTMMTLHHRGAIEMARSERADGRYGPAKTMAGTIVHTQSEEITTMADLLKSM
jgi:uncharacterized protein (DUF305 family)